MIEKSEVHRKIPYRPDIDGLRAISILFVFISHMGYTYVGNIGVDIFFVLSGYLITGILLKEHREGTYSLKQFYIRRVKRIFPVLYISIAVFLLMTYFFFNKYMKLTGEHAVCSILMCLNLCFINFHVNPQP